MKKIFLFSLILFFSQFFYLTAKGFSDLQTKNFSLSAKTDIPLLAVGASVSIAAFSLQTFCDFWKKDFYNFRAEKSSVNAFDSFFLTRYSKPLSVASDVLRIFCIFTPLSVTFSLGFKKFSPHATLLIMFAETLLFTYGTTDILKTFVSRARPYSYFKEDAPYKKIKNGDWAASFPSGHTSISFASAAFASYVFCAENKNSKWKIPVCITSFSLASVTAVLRIASGNHFLTDIFSGAVIGCAYGFLIPFFHKKKICDFEISPLPLGVVFRKKI